MKLVATLTFHNACNYGAFLQAYALNQTLQSFSDVEASILDYQSPALKNAYRARALLKQKGKLANKMLSMLLRSKDIWKRNLMFKEQQKKCFRINQCNVSREQLEECAEQYDMVIAGSDQIWNFDLTQQDTSFFLDFVKESKKKFSYAASIGKSDLTEKEVNKMAVLLNDFEEISVREEEFAKTLKEVVRGKEIHVHVDPVFLFKKNDWSKFAEKISSKPYILLFIMGIAEREKHLISAAKELSRDTGLPIKYLSDQERWFKYSELEHVGVVTPQNFVGLIEGAEYVVTNSFHGTAFSILMHTTFFVDTGVARSSRIKNLLALTTLEKQGFNAEDGILHQENISKEKWMQVDDILEKERGRAMDYLSKVVNH